MLLLGLWVRILVSFWFVDDLPLCPDTVGTVDPSTGGTTVSVVTKDKVGGSGGGKGNCRGEGSVSLGGPSSIPGRCCCARVGSAAVHRGSRSGGQVTDGKPNPAPATYGTAGGGAGGGTGTGGAVGTACLSTGLTVALFCSHF